jgi:hypothetical protein
VTPNRMYVIEERALYKKKVQSGSRLSSSLRSYPQRAGNVPLSQRARSGALLKGRGSLCALDVVQHKKCRQHINNTKKLILESGTQKHEITLINLYGSRYYLLLFN